MEQQLQTPKAPRIYEVWSKRLRAFVAPLADPRGIWNCNPFTDSGCGFCLLRFRPGPFLHYLGTHDKQLLQALTAGQPHALKWTVPGAQAHQECSNLTNSTIGIIPTWVTGGRDTTRSQPQKRPKPIRCGREHYCFEFHVLIL